MTYIPWIVAVVLAGVVGAIVSAVYFTARLMAHISNHNYVCTRCGTNLKYRIVNYQKSEPVCVAPADREAEESFRKHVEA